jgi:UDP-glucose 4-epimerase
MDVLVTGSAGFTGQILVPRLQAAGHRVIGVDIEPDHLSDTFIRHDLTGPLEQKMAADVVIHLASTVGGFLFNLKEELAETNDRINHTVLEICREVGCDHLIFFSSINVFEVNQSFAHDRLLVADQKTPYARSKAQGEFLFCQGTPNCTIIRPTNLFGKSQRRKHQIVGESHVIPDLLEKIERGGDLHVLGDGTQVRNFVHVNDICEFVVRNIRFQGQHFFNLRSEITLTIAELAKILIEISGEQTPMRFDPSYMSYELFCIPNFDLTLPRHYGWKPKIQTIQDGLLI